MYNSVQKSNKFAQICIPQILPLRVVLQPSNYAAICVLNFKIKFVSFVTKKVDKISLCLIKF